MTSRYSLIHLLVVRFLFSEKSDRLLSTTTVVALFGMAFGVAALFITLSVIQGFQKAYKESLLKFNSHVVLTSADEIEDPDLLIDRLIPPEMRREIVGWNPFIYREGMIITGSQLKGIVIKGVDFEQFGNLSQMKIALPSPQESKAVPSLIIGKELAKELGPSVKTVKLFFPHSFRGGGEKPRKFAILGTFESGLYEYDSSFAFLPLREAQRFFQMGKKVSGIELWLKDPDRAPHWVERLQSQFSFPYLVLSWRDINENLFRALEVEKMVFFLLMIVLTAVASFNILASLIMLLLQKRGQIAILRALGLSWSEMRKVFLFDGLLIGFVGLTLGFLLALGVLFFIERWQPIPLAPEVYFINHVPVEYSWSNFWWVVASGFTLVGVGCWLTLRRLSVLPILRTLMEAS